MECTNLNRNERPTFKQVKNKLTKKREEKADKNKRVKNIVCYLMKV
jgi:hypothetical protein